MIVLISGDSKTQLKLADFCYEKLVEEYGHEVIKISVRVANDGCLLINNRVVNELSGINVNGDVELFITSRKLYDCLLQCLGNEKCKRKFYKLTGVNVVSAKMCTKQSFHDGSNTVKNGLIGRIKKMFGF